MTPETIYIGPDVWYGPDDLGNYSRPASSIRSAVQRVLRRLGLQGTVIMPRGSLIEFRERRPDEPAWAVFAMSVSDVSISSVVVFDRVGPSQSSAGSGAKVGDRTGDSPFPGAAPKAEDTLCDDPYCFNRTAGPHSHRGALGTRP